MLIGILELWRAKRAGRAMPSRADFDPFSLGKKLLPHVLLTEPVPEGGRLRFRFRLTGTALTEAAGLDLTGHFVDELNPNKRYAAYIEGIYQKVMETRRPVFSSSIAIVAKSRARRRTRRLTCPLSKDGHAVNMFVSGQTFQAMGTGTLPTLTYADDFEMGETIVVDPD